MTATATWDVASRIEPLVELVRGKQVVVLAGAGCSTESGIPDYRGPTGSLRTRKPMQYKEFVSSESARTRYWARSSIGWQRIICARPNPGHAALARLEEGGVVSGVITQNVDGLHQSAGSRRVVELHGSLYRVRCLSCGRAIDRRAYQDRLVELNSGWWSGSGGLTEMAEQAPDGDAELPIEAFTGFEVPDCDTCGGIMKPDVVFFGENVPAATVREAWDLFGKGEVLLVVGSSLTVYSGRRFVYQAQNDGTPIGIVNLGPTRADDVAAAKVEGSLGVLLPRLAAALLG
jgi:NAD+-dependent protein deacetylase sirtuin 4